jgi:hypothetical protein
VLFLHHALVLLAQDPASAAGWAAAHGAGDERYGEASGSVSQCWQCVVSYACRSPVVVVRATVDEGDSIERITVLKRRAQ